jgi:hypothetical protein
VHERAVQSWPVAQSETRGLELDGPVQTDAQWCVCVPQGPGVLTRAVGRR